MAWEGVVRQGVVGQECLGVERTAKEMRGRAGKAWPGQEWLAQVCADRYGMAGMARSGDVGHGPVCQGW